MKRIIIEKVFNFFPHFFPQRKSGRIDVGISVLLCHSQVTMFLYSMQSLMFFLGEDFQIFIIDDGTLTRDDLKKIRQLFTIKITSQSRAIILLNEYTKKFRYLSCYFQNNSTHIKKIKFAALFLSPFNKTICLEPDVLFFSMPNEIVKWVQSEVKNNYYSVFDKSLKNILSPEPQIRNLFGKILNKRINPFFNGGIILFSGTSKDQINLLNFACKLIFEVDYQNTFYCDELLLSILLIGRKNKLLSRKYKNWLSTKALSKIRDQNDVSIHFVGQNKKHFPKEAIKIAYSSSFFRSH